MRPEHRSTRHTGACAAREDGDEWRALRDKRYTYAKHRVDGRELLFDHVADPYQMKDLADSPERAGTMERFRAMLADRMSDLDDTFEACTWYRDHWTKDRVILHGAKE